MNDHYHIHRRRIFASHGYQGNASLTQARQYAFVPNVKAAHEHGVLDVVGSDGSDGSGWFNIFIYADQNDNEIFRRVKNYMLDCELRNW